MPGKWDWGELFAYYASLGPTRTYGQVVEHFGVSQRQVERVAVRDRWPERAMAIDEKAQTKAEAVVIRDRAARVADSIKIIDAARTRFAGQLGKESFQLTGAEFVGMVKLEQLLEGEATDRIAFAEVEALLAGVFRAARAVVDEALGEAKANGKRAIVLGYFDKHLPARVAELTTGGDVLDA